MAAMWGAFLFSGGAQAHEVKDPVCRMAVDSDTTPHSHKTGGKSYFFCSAQCETSFTKNPAKYVKLARELETSEGKRYEVALTTSEPAVAGQPTELAFAVRYAGTQRLVKEFEVTHEKLMHLIIMSEDMSYFEHEHPVRGEDGVFRLSWTFPRGGRYRLYTDFTPTDGDNQIKLVPLEVRGEEAPRERLVPDQTLTRLVGDYTVSLAARPKSLEVEKQAVLTYTVRDAAGRPVTDMQPYIGAMGHLFAVSQDGKEVVHTHALHGAPQASHGAGEAQLTPEMTTKTGPTHSFKLALPTSGLYKVWAQFMHKDRVLTVPFTFAVKDPWQSGSGAATSAPAKGAKNTPQRATIQINGGYSPSSVRVKAGRPVALTLVRREKGGCGGEVVFPSLGIKRTLKSGGKTVVSFTPKKTGTITFTCGMGMYKGQVVVQ